EVTSGSQFYSQCLGERFVCGVDISPELDSTVGIGPGSPIEQMHRQRLPKAHRPLSFFVQCLSNGFTSPARIASQQILRQLDGLLDSNAPMTQVALASREQPARGSVMEVHVE